MAQKSFGWGVTLNAMIPEDGVVVIPTPGFVQGQVDTENAEVAYDGYLLMADQYELSWESDGSSVSVSNRTKHLWEINKGVYVSCPRLALDASSLEEINTTLAEHDAAIGDLDTRIAALEASQGAQDTTLAGLEARVAALEAATPPAQRKEADRR